MKRIQIKSIEDSLFQEAWSLYITSFPIDERRDIEVQELILKHTDYHFEVVVKGDEFIGFITWWKFDQLRFIEHFATLDVHRGKGYGKLILNELLSESDELTILEVELPNSELNQRRIKFYERLGFILNPYEYKQLPLRKEGVEVNLLVMSYPITLKESLLSEFEKEFKLKCYDDFMR